MEEVARKSNTVAPRGLSKPQAASYIGVSVGLFDLLVSEHKMPKAKQIASRKVWDVFEIDQAFEILPHDGAEISHDQEPLSDFV
ncbi:hypothetical protein [Pseudovibrio sp. Tun.PSC04-5.I4]|uniref:helix-turn-helix transcriptional regulator n=1 Tax=Pseudovibrio sp. Tun.PSC04-5.I4 TaxID=1798213 RepID=UPI000892302B|nr:hypothetical protein [Pseudovibrio sp. Tun.PSC04-5.I4]SDQ27757.1 hypothetical protein SAMN04515695_0689 [Pseudovibrio sp. Tun.PSC04-5.I4]SDR10345.1 hypothetical protein SAMN04515695_2779 [Pseudovibrio sp. Tun.PSC04-5.I4]